IGKIRIRKAKNLFIAILNFFKTLKLIKTKKIDLIFILNDFFPQIVSYFTFKLTKIPFIVNYRGNVSFERRLELKNYSLFKREIRLIINRFYDIIEDFTLKRAKAVICNNYLSKKLLLKNKIKNDRLYVVWRGVNYEKFNPNKFTDDEKSLLRTKLDLKDDDFILIYVGRLVPKKGIIYLLQAFKEIKREIPKIKLLIIGSGPLKNELNMYAQNNDLNEVIFLNEQSHDNLPILYAISDIFILPALSEGLPNVILEAMASAKPFISTKVGDVPQIFRNAKNNNILIDTQNQKQIIEGIKYFYINKEKLSEIGMKNREYILRNISWKNFADSIIRIFKTNQ
ncbi:MAG: glycosyltransferase family 4 protein, partial [Candidatus Hodarchaeota archaeon]